MAAHDRGEWAGGEAADSDQLRADEVAVRRAPGQHPALDARQEQRTGPRGAAEVELAHRRVRRGPPAAQPICAAERGLPSPGRTSSLHGLHERDGRAVAPRTLLSREAAWTSGRSADGDPRRLPPT